MRAVLVGNYGDGNMGDEALRSYFERSFPLLSWRVVTAHPSLPSDLPRLPGGVRSFFSFQWMSTVVAIARADVLVFGGGTLFADHESVHACFLWYTYSLCARFFRVPVSLSFQGVGPFRTILGRMIAGFVYRSAAFISVRDDVSYHRTFSFRTLVPIIRTTDPVFPSISSLFTPQLHSSSSTLAIIPRFNSSPSFFEALQSLVQERSFSSVHILCLQDVDVSAVDRVQSVLPPSLSVTTVACPSIESVVDALRDISVVCTQRYHGALASLFLQKETIIIPQMTGDKLDALQQSSLSFHEQMHLYKQGEESLCAFFSHFTRK